MTRVIAGLAGGRRLKVPAGRATRPTSDRAREGLFGTVESLLGSLQGARVLDLYAGSGAVGLEAISRGAVQAVLVESSPAAIRVIRANIAALGLAGAQLVADRVEKVLARGPAALAVPAASPTPTAPPNPKSPGNPTGPGNPTSLGNPTGPEDLTSPANSKAPATPSTFPATKSSKTTPAFGDPKWREGSAGPRFEFVFADPPYAMEDGEVAAMLRLLRERGWLVGGALVALERSSGGDPLEWPAGYVGDRARRYGDATLWYGLAAGV
jgi:16S rRNA (guanine966-N2)-methyltransferase